MTRSVTAKFLIFHLYVYYVYIYIYIYIYIAFSFIMLLHSLEKFNLFTLNFLHMFVLGITHIITYSKKIHTLKTTARSLFGLIKRSFWRYSFISLELFNYFLLRFARIFFLNHPNIFYYPKIFFTAFLHLLEATLACF